MHGVENQDSHAKMGVNGQCVQPLCLPAICMHLWVICQWCMHSWSCCCRGFVEAYRDLLELVCKYHLGARCGGISSYGKIPCITKATGMPGQLHVSLWHQIVVIVTKVEAMKPPTTQTWHADLHCSWKPHGRSMNIVCTRTDTHTLIWIKY